MHLLLVLAVLTGQVQDTVRVSATLSDAVIDVGESIVLEINVETQGARARIEPGPDLPAGLDVLGTSHHDQRQFSLPGGQRRIMGQRLVILARAPGRYRIPEFSIEVDGRSYRTPAQALTVNPNASAVAPSTRSVITRAPDDEVKLDATLDADTVYIGEQVTLTAEAKFSRDARMRLRRSPEYEPPSPSGFWIQDLPDAGTTASRVEGNRVYEVQAFRRAYFPLSAGEFTLPPARLIYELRRGMLYAPRSHELRSDSLALVVLPVPEEDQPEGYTGAVGSFVVDAYLEPREVPAGEAAVLTMEVHGQGNIKSLAPPRLPELPDVQTFPPSEEADTHVTDGIISGVKRFSWVLIPRESGTVELPGIRFAYFDPDRAEFLETESAPLSLFVREGDPTASLDAAPADQLRLLKLAPASPSLQWVPSPYFALAQLIPLLGLGLIVIRRRPRTERVTRRGLRRRRKQVIAELRLRVAAEDDRDFFVDMATAARAWLARRLGDDAVQTAPPPRLGRILGEKGVGRDVARQLTELLGRLAAARYAPTPPPAADRDRLLRELERALERIDEQATDPPRTRPASARAGVAAMAMVLAMAGSALAGPDATAQDRPEDVFRRGVEAFQAGNPERAARAFEEYTRIETRDGHGWYNLGNSYYSMGQRGLAVWAWLKALRLQPRDDDIRHNLTAAGTSPALVSMAAPGLPLTPRETLLGASIGWIAASVGFAIFLLRRHRGAAIAAGVCMLVALVLIVAWAMPGMGKDVGVVVEPGSQLLAAPTLRADPLRPFGDGEGVTILTPENDWLRVRTVAGEQGWVEAERVRRL